ncbi:hypothetical protein PHAVU_008G123533 [Phaseolus vulgaris]|uniref:DUF3307 domain-containing protein n=1 Tax=Phaseolus vulgaris TaxID=3885 RepID=V7BDA2_PHAVU|nr:hypothetical protein PHAVU_007G102700g [Phaseolus vulgaris]ESW15794.1 hypothetical protein PHAVU_007G102700g [Phaseolus vulgaris]
MLTKEGEYFQIKSLDSLSTSQYLDETTYMVQTIILYVLCLQVYKSFVLFMNFSHMNYILMYNLFLLMSLHIVLDKAFHYRIYWTKNVRRGHKVCWL